MGGNSIVGKSKCISVVNRLYCNYYIQTARFYLALINLNKIKTCFLWCHQNINKLSYHLLFANGNSMYQLNKNCTESV